VAPLPSLPPAGSVAPLPPGSSLPGCTAPCTTLCTVATWDRSQLGTARVARVASAARVASGATLPGQRVGQIWRSAGPGRGEGRAPPAPLTLPRAAHPGRTAPPATLPATERGPCAGLLRGYRIGEGGREGEGRVASAPGQGGPPPSLPPLPSWSICPKAPPIAHSHPAGCNGAPPPVHPPCPPCRPPCPPCRPPCLTRAGGIAVLVLLVHHPTDLPRARDPPPAGRAANPPCGRG
jgi:hypothetical protein